MEKISLPFFYQLGTQLKPVTELKVEASNRLSIIVASFPVLGSIKYLLDSFSTLTVCRTVGKELIDAIDDIRIWMQQTEFKKWEEPDSSADTKFQLVIDKAKEFEIVLSAELQTLATYHATQKGIYSTPDLIERTENIFPESVLKKINSEIREETRQSGKCLAFDCATASGFHIMRATELVMYEYYISVCKPKPIPKERLENWGTYIKELQKSSKAEVKEVVAMLQQIKDRHRNLIMHPEIVLTPDEAFTVFEIAQAAIIAMADKIPLHKTK